MDGFGGFGDGTGTVSPDEILYMSDGTPVYIYPYGTDIDALEEIGAIGGGYQPSYESPGTPSDLNGGFNGDIFGIQAEAQAEMANLRGITDSGSGSGNVSDIIVYGDGEGTEDNIGEETIRSSVTPTPVIETVYVVSEDPRIDDILDNLILIEQGCSEQGQRLENIELSSLIIVAVLCMLMGGLVAYGFLRRIFV